MYFILIHHHISFAFCFGHQFYFYAIWCPPTSQKHPSIWTGFIASMCEYVRVCLWCPAMDCHPIFGVFQHHTQCSLDSLRSTASRIQWLLEMNQSINKTILWNNSTLTDFISLIIYHSNLKKHPCEQTTISRTCIVCPVSQWDIYHVLSQHEWKVLR